MTTITKDFVAKLAVAFVAVAMVVAAFAPAAQAQTTEELQAMINDLLAQVAALQGGGAPAAAAGVCPYTWTRDLSSGSTGADVMKLQQFLNANPDTRVAATGAGSAGMETEYYGPATAAAVSKFQVANRAEVLTPAGLVNPTGYFGPSSRAAANAQCVSAPVMDDDDDDMMDDDDDDNDGPKTLSGEASLDSAEADDAADEDIEEGDEDAEIGSLTVTFEDGDAEISRLDISLLADGDTDTSTVEPWEAFESISLWVDGDKIAEKDADDEDDYLDEDEGTLRFSGLDLFAEDGEDVEIVVAATVQNNLDSAEQTTWDLRFVSMRYFDADGVATTDTTTEDISSHTSSDDVEFTVGEEGADDELRVKSSTNDPDSVTLQLEDDENSDWLTIFVFELDTDDSTNDIQVEGLRVDVAATEDGTTATSTGNLIDDARLVVDGETYDDVTITHGINGTFVFDLDDEDFFIDAGDAVDVEFQVEFEALPTALEGATVQASTSDTGLSAEGADNLSGGQLSGASTGEEHTLRTEGAILSPDDTEEELKENSDGTDADDEGVFTVSFEVTAFETDIYVNKSAASGTTMGTAGANYLVEDSAGDPVGAGTSTAVLTSSADTEGTRFIVEEGETETFTLTVEYDPATSGFYQMQVYSLNFNNVNDDPDTQQRALDESDYETDSLSI